MRRTLTFGVFILSLGVLACSDRAKSNQEYIRQAEISLKNKDYGTAIVQLQSAVKADPKSGQSRLRLGEAYEAVGNLPQARSEYVRAADLMPSDIPAQLSATRILIASRQFEDAKSRAEKALKLDPKNVDAHLMRGQAAAGMNDLGQAAEAFDQAIALEPGRPDLLLNRGRLRVVEGDAGEAEASFKQATVVAPSSVEARLGLADFYWFSGKMDAAEKALKEAVALDVNNATAARTLAAFYVSTNRLAEAEAPLKTAIAANPDPRLKILLADYLAATKRENEATAILKDLAKVSSTRSPATIRLATLEFAKPNHGSGYALLDDLLKVDPNNSALLTTKAQFLASEGKKQEALKTAQLAANADPESSSAFELIGALYASVHELQKAEVAFKEALRLNNRATRAMIMLASLNLTMQKPDAAVELSERALQNQPGNGEAQLGLVRALTAVGNLGRARTEASKLPPNVAAVQVALGDLELRQGNKGAARMAYERATSLDPKSTDAVRGLVAVDALDKKLDSAVRRVEGVVATNPNDGQLLLLAARTHLAAGDLAAAEAKSRAALDKDPSLRPAYDLLGIIYRQQNKLQEAQRLYEKVAAERPSDIPAHTMAGVLQLVRGDQAGARQRFETVLSIDPRAAVASNNLAYMDAEAGTNLDLALNRAQIAKSALPNDAEVDDTLGWIYVKKGLPALALSPLAEAVKKDGENPVYQYHLGKAYAGMGDKDSARTTLAKALRLSPNFSGADDARRTLESLGR